MNVSNIFESIKKHLNGSIKVDRQRLHAHLSFFENYNTLFIHIPKTGGISIYQSLFERDSFGHIPVSEYYKLLPREVFSAIFKFAIVRNPYTRTFSAYQYLSAGGRNTGLDRLYQNDLRSFPTYESFLCNWLRHPKNKYKIQHFIPQSKFVTIRRKLAVDFVGKTENLEEDFKFITNTLSLTTHSLVQTNVTKNKPKEENLSLKMKAIIEEAYAEDFRLFNYQKH